MNICNCAITFSVCSFRHVKREGNMLAYNLSKVRLENSTGYVDWDDLPDGVCNVDLASSFLLHFLYCT